MSKGKYTFFLVDKKTTRKQINDAKDKGYRIADKCHERALIADGHKIAVTKKTTSKPKAKV